MTIREQLDSLQKAFMALTFEQRIFAYEVHYQGSAEGVCSLVEEYGMLSPCVQFELIEANRAMYSVTPEFEELFVKRPRQCFADLDAAIEEARQIMEANNGTL